VLSNPTFTLTERKAVLDALLPSLNLHPVGTSFARLLLEKGRFGALPQVLGEYQAMTDIEAGRVRAEVVASGEMSPEVKTAIAAALSKATGKNVVLTTRTDPSLLGGLVARVGSQVFDASLKTRLDNIQRSLLDES
jgi:F-type H+-transporting ATPase subunit delta